MKLKLLTGLAALLLAATSHAGNVYSACEYEGSTGRPFTQLFTLEGDALEAGATTYEDILAWEARFPNKVLQVGTYRLTSFVGQFMKFVESKNSSGACMVTSDKERAFIWYRERLKQSRYDKFTIADWRPTKDAFIAVEQWPPN